MWYLVTRGTGSDTLWSYTFSLIVLLCYTAWKTAWNNESLSSVAEGICPIFLFSLGWMKLLILRQGIILFQLGTYKPLFIVRSDSIESDVFSSWCLFSLGNFFFLACISLCFYFIFTLQFSILITKCKAWLNKTPFSLYEAVGLLWLMEVFSRYKWRF